MITMWLDITATGLKISEYEVSNENKSQEHPREVKLPGKDIANVTIWDLFIILRTLNNSETINDTDVDVVDGSEKIL